MVALLIGFVLTLLTALATKDVVADWSFILRLIAFAFAWLMWFELTRRVMNWINDEWQ